MYAGGLDPDEDGEYAYAWWDDIGQILYHTATLMPNHPHEPHFNNKKRHIGNDLVRIIWNDSGMPYRFDTLATQFQFVNIVIEPHSPLGAIAAFSSSSSASSSPSTTGPSAGATAAPSTTSNSLPGGPGSQPQHENEYFRVTVQRAPGMTEFTPIGNFKLISAENLPLLVRQLSLLADWFAEVFQHTQGDTVQVEVQTNWRARLQAIKRFRAQMPPPPPSSLAEQPEDGGEESSRDFTVEY